MNALLEINDIEYPDTYLVKNFIKNTQPESLLKYKCIYNGNFVKLFFLPMHWMTILHDNTIYRSLQNSQKIKINGKNCYKFKIFVPDLIFAVDNSNQEYLTNKHHMRVFATNSKLKIQDLINGTAHLFHAPLPNMYNSGAICQTDKLSHRMLYSDFYKNIVKNSFDICEYYIDSYISSTFNNDLNNILEETVRSYGFSQSQLFYDFISNSDNILKIKYLYENMCASTYLSKDVQKVIQNGNSKTQNTNIFSCISKNQYSSHLKKELRISLIKSNLDTFDTILKINDFIYYDNKIVKILYFSVEFSSPEDIKTEQNLPSQGYIEYIDEDQKYGKIMSSKFDKIRLVEYKKYDKIKIDNNLYESGNFIQNLPYFYKIDSIYKQNLNDQCVFKIIVGADCSGVIDEKNLIYKYTTIDDYNKYVDSFENLQICEFFTDDQMYRILEYVPRLRVYKIVVDKLYNSVDLKENICFYGISDFCIGIPDSDKYVHIYDDLENSIRCTSDSDDKLIESDYLINQEMLISNLGNIYTNNNNQLYTANDIYFDKDRYLEKVKSNIEKYNKDGFMDVSVYDDGYVYRAKFEIGKKYSLYGYARDNNPYDKQYLQGMELLSFKFRDTEVENEQSHIYFKSVSTIYLSFRCSDNTIVCLNILNFIYDNTIGILECCQNKYEKYINKFFKISNFSTAIVPTSILRICDLNNYVFEAKNIFSANDRIYILTQYDIFVEVYEKLFDNKIEWVDSYTEVCDVDRIKNGIHEISSCTSYIFPDINGQKAITKLMQNMIIET